MKKHLTKSFKKILIVLILIMTIVNVFSVTPINEKTFAVTEPNIIKDGNTYYYVMSDGTKINYIIGFINDQSSSPGSEFGFAFNSADPNYKKSELGLVLNSDDPNYKKAETELKNMGYDVYLDSKGNAKKLTAKTPVKKKGNDYYYVMKDGTEVKYVIDKNSFYFEDYPKSSKMVNGYVLSSDDKNYAAAKKELEDMGYSIYLDDKGNLQKLDNPTYSTTQKNTTGSNSSDDSIFEKFINGVAGLILYPLKILPLLLGKIIQAVMGVFTGNNGTLSIEDILFNKLDITKVDFFNMSTGNEVVDTIRKNVAIWYYSLRNISAVILIAILVYVGLRMALSTIADEKARYSEMIVNWVISIALLFVLHFIIELVIILNNQIVNILANNIDKSDPLDKIYMNAWSVGFVEGFGNAICYLVLVGMTMVFLLSYLKRMITVGFLIVIAPLVTITYSIDKMGDNKSQALDSWLKEFVYNILIQPFQCVTYIILAGSAMKILDNEASLAAMIVAIMMIVFVYESEKIIRHIFHFEARTMSETVAQAALVGSTLGLFAGGGGKRTSLSSEEKDENKYKQDKEYAEMQKKSTNTQNAGSNETTNGAANGTTNTIANGKVTNKNPHKKSRRVGNAISAVTNNKLFQEYATMAKTGSKMLLGGSFSLATGSPTAFINKQSKILKSGLEQRKNYMEERNKHQLQQAYKQAEDEARENLINNRIKQRMNVDSLDDLTGAQKEQAEEIRANIEQAEGDNLTEQAKGYVALKASQILRGDAEATTEAEENMKDSIEKLRTYYTDNGMSEDYTNVQISEDLSDIRKGKYREATHAGIEVNNAIKDVKDAGKLAEQTGEIVAKTGKFIATPVTAPVNKIKKYYRKKQEN